MFVEDADKKKALADIYRTNFNGYRQLPPPEYPEGDSRAEQRDRVVSSAEYLAEHMHEAPWLLVPCLEGRVDDAPQLGASYWGSLLPAAWSYMLALRSRGLGSAYTTLHLLGDGEKQAAEVLGIPFEKYSQGGLSRSPTPRAPTSGRPSGCRSKTSCTGTAGNHTAPKKPCWRHAS